MTTKLKSPMTCCITPCRSDPPRYARFVRYDRVAPDRVRPVLVYVDAEQSDAQWLEWDRIRPANSVDPETQAAWSAHVKLEMAKAEARRVEAQSRYRAAEGRLRRPIGETGRIT